MDLFCDAHEIMQRYAGHIGEVRRLLVFHGLSCGQMESFGALGAKLADSRAFRTDLSALARGVRDAEAGGISAEEMLTILALAVGGVDLVAGRSAAVGLRNAVTVVWVLLDGVGGWRETGGAVRGAAEGVDALEATPAAELGGFAGAVPGVEAGSAEVLGALPPTGPGDRVELAIRELRVYLDDIDRRMCRLEPHVEGLSQTVQASEQRRERMRGEETATAWEMPEPVVTGVTYGGNGAAGNGAAGNGAGAIAAAWSARGREEFGVTDAPEASVAGREVEEYGDDDGERQGFRETEPELPESLPEPKWEGAAGMRMEMGDEEPRPVDWRRRIGVGMGVAALLFALVGLGGLWEMSRSPAGPTGSGGSGAAATAGTPPAATGGEAAANAGVGSHGESPGSGVVAPATGKAPVAEPPPVIAEEAPAPPRSEERGVREPGAGSPAPPEAAAGARVTGRRAEAPGMVARAIPPAAAPAASRAVGRAEEPRAGSEVKGHKAAAPRVLKTAPPVVARSAPAAPRRSTAPSPAGAPARSVAVTPSSSVPPAGGTASPGERAVVEVRSTGAKVVSARRPVYPTEALRAHTEATVVLNAFLAKDGTVRRMDVVKGAYGFNRSAMDAVWGWRYQPLVVHGQAVESETQITVDYRMH